MTLPISVVVPHKQSRRKFFVERCFPAILSNDPAEVIVVPNDGSFGGGGPFRNRGAAKVVNPFVIFVDDDSVLLPGALAKMHAVLAGGADIAYGDYRYVTYRHGPTAPPCVVTKEPGPWDLTRLFRGNYISMVSLIATALVPRDENGALRPFDPAFCKLDDWDLWLTLAKRGARGSYIPEVLFEDHKIDRCVSDSDEESNDTAIKRVKAKHKLP